MEFKRPDLSNVSPDILAYIESLEAEIIRLQQTPARSRTQPRSFSTSEDVPVITEPVSEPNEPPTTMNVITATRWGHAKRTPRHLYSRQRRGGMGIFDLDAPDNQPPAILALADQAQTLLLLTSHGRAFRLPVSAIPETPVRSRGDSIVGRLNLQPDETLVSLLPDQPQGYIALLGQRGFVRLLRHHIFGEFMKPGTVLLDTRTAGPLVSACWTPGDSDLFIASRLGRAIRFSEKSLPPQGGLGMRLPDDDTAVAVTGVDDDSLVFLINADGKGTFRLMSSFTPNKTPGAGGKIAMSTDNLVAAFAASGRDDVFIISELSKIIRFRLDEVPAKDGVVQGVICMSLRADQCVAAIMSPGD
jgi:DNA gyrase subunit A